MNLRVILLVKKNCSFVFETIAKIVRISPLNFLILNKRHNLFHFQNNRYFLILNKGYHLFYFQNNRLFYNIHLINIDYF